MISMTAATEEYPHEHRTIFPQLRARVTQPNPVLFIPEIMLEIGTYLQKQELWASSLVCVAWHKVFSPFLDWTALDHAEDFLQGALCLHCSSDSTSHHCKKRWRYLDNILGRIDGPDAALGFHSTRNPYFSNRIIEYDGPWEDPTGRERYNPRLDRLYIMLVEKSTLLEKLQLNPRNCSDDQCYRWTTQLELRSTVHLKKSGTSSSSLNSRLSDGGPPSSVLLRYHRSPTPRWPRLVKVSLEGCRVDHSFLRILLSNAPALEDLCVYKVTASQAEARQVEFDTMDNSKQGLSPSGINSSTSTSVITELLFSDILGLSWRDIFLFARQLPRLLEFSIDFNGTRREEEPLFIPGFRQLGRLVLHSFPCDVAAFMVRSVPAGLLDLRLFKTHLDLSLVQSLTINHTHSLQSVYIYECPLAEGDNVFHHIMNTLHGLEIFQIFGDPVVCDPEVIQQTPWVCRNLQRLHFIPKCNGSSLYSLLEAQEALMTQIGSLTNLRELYLERHYSDYDFMETMETGFAPEASWTLLSSLTKLKEVDLGFLPDVLLTARDARMMVRYWPHLGVLHSVNTERNKAFVDYMKENRPKLQLQCRPRY